MEEKENTIKEPAQGPVAEKSETVRGKKGNRFLNMFSAFALIKKDHIVKQMPFILFITGLCMLYISNHYYAEKTIREINAAKNELKEKRAAYISTESELNFNKNQSEVARLAAPMGIKETLEPPKKIIVNKKSDTKKTEQSE